ncbi:LINE-1 retrotransposable element ORF1 protein [Plecturocebus cupreus]
MIVRFTRVEMKEKMLRAAREKVRVTHKGKPIRLTADLSAETLQARREWGPTFNILKEKNFQPRISYPAKLSFISEGKIKFFANKQVLRDYITTRPALQELLKEALHMDRNNQYQPFQKHSKRKAQLLLELRKSILFNCFLLKCGVEGALQLRFPPERSLSGMQPPLGSHAFPAPTAFSRHVDPARSTCTPGPPPELLPTQDPRPAGKHPGEPFDPAAWDWGMPERPASAVHQAAVLPVPHRLQLYLAPPAIFSSSR